MSFSCADQTALSGLKDWSFGTVQRQVQGTVNGHTVTGYPAMVDDGASVRGAVGDPHPGDAVLDVGCGSGMFAGDATAFRWRSRISHMRSNRCAVRQLYPLARTKASVMAWCT